MKIFVGLTKSKHCLNQFGIPLVSFLETLECYFLKTVAFR